METRWGVLGATAGEGVTADGQGEGDIRKGECGDSCTTAHTTSIENALKMPNCTLERWNGQHVNYISINI